MEHQERPNLCGEIRQYLNNGSGHEMAVPLGTVQSRSLLLGANLGTPLLSSRLWHHFFRLAAVRHIISTTEPTEDEWLAFAMGNNDTLCKRSVVG
jgi:hypothetical protein